MEKTKFRSASRVGLPSSEERKKPRFVRVGFRKTKTQRFGWASEERKPKDSGGLPKNENPKVKIRSGGLLKNGKRRTFKIRSGGFPSFQGTEKTKDSVSVFQRMEKTKILQWASEEQPKTKIRLVSQVDSDKQKKPKIRNFGGFPKDQDS
ncbi:hypothetical protein GLOIN_2v1779851 [Rhizophagus irregularis DAOM 181602=DAOM 197198]|nr:hypothetical protein GLOIN_2v1779851 [Rhizophagus irregularis DAOM 181602=DAOM 197198]